MGVSTDAYLIFGIALTDFDEEDYGNLPFASEVDEDFDDTLVRLAGGKQYPEEGWLEEQRKVVEACPLSVISHCHFEYPMWILGIKATHLTASRGYPKTFDSLPEVTPEDFMALKKFAEKYDIKGELTWHLCSDWG
jgi:hypothetical protein